MTKQELLDKANDLPLAPGVYLMMDKTGCVIYVGKALSCHFCYIPYGYGV